ncbi:MAG: APC family permease, partial [Micrococcales bacterium]|nr:APC family permease [Micrococcales bacterium]
TAIAVMLVELLVSVAVIRYFMSNPGTHWFKSIVAPAISTIALGFGLYLLMSRFNLLSGLAPTVEATGVAWSLTTLGWILVLLPFIALVIGILWGLINKKDEGKLSEDILS